MSLKMKLLEIEIKRLERKAKRLDKKVTRRLGRSYRDVINAIRAGLDDKDVCTIRKSIARIDSDTGALVDYLVYFPEYDLIAKLRYYIEAYLTTNEDVLEEKQIDELKNLLKYI